MSRFTGPNRHRRAEDSLRCRGVDLDSVESMVQFVLDHGGEVEFEQHYTNARAEREGTDEGRTNLTMVTLRLAGKEHCQGSHPLEALRRLLVEEWAALLSDGERRAAEAHVGV